MEKEKKSKKLFFVVLVIVVLFIGCYILHTIVRPMGCYGTSPTICFDKFNRFHNSYFDGEIGYEGFYFYNPFSKVIHYYYDWDDDLNFFTGSFSDKIDKVKVLNKNFIILENNDILLNLNINKTKIKSELNIKDLYKKGGNLYYFYDNEHVVIYTNSKYIVSNYEVYDLDDNYYLIEVLYDTYKENDLYLIYDNKNKMIIGANIYDGPVSFDNELINKLVDNKVMINKTFIDKNNPDSKIIIKDNIYENDGKVYEIKLKYFSREYIYFEIENNVEGHLYIRCNYNLSNVDIVKYDANGSNFINTDYYGED